MDTQPDGAATGRAEPSLAVAALITAVTGYVDAFVYLRVYPLFTANQSGNLILAAMAVGQAHWAEALAPLASIVGYVGGAALGVRLAARAGDDDRRFAGVLAATVVALSGLAVALAATGIGRHHARQAGLAVMALVIATSVTMGVHGVSVRRARGQGVLTTASTGNLTTVGSAVAHLAEPTLRPHAVEEIRVVGGVVVAYVSGAVASAAWVHLADPGPAVLVVPIAVTLGLLSHQLAGR